MSTPPRRRTERLDQTHEEIAKLWETRAGKPLTPADGCEIAEAVKRFRDVLFDIDATQRQRRGSEPT